MTQIRPPWSSARSRTRVRALSTAGRLAVRPYIPSVEGRNIRTGLFKLADFGEVEHYRGTIGYNLRSLLTRLFSDARS